MLKYKQGDAIEAFEQDEINVCLSQSNCEALNYFAGFAKKLHQKYPELTKLHQLHCNQDNVFGSSFVYNPNLKITPVNKYIVNMYSQYYRGQPSSNNFTLNDYLVCDSFENRTLALKSCLKYVDAKFHREVKIGLPLIASGLAADKKLKGTMTDLEYFKKYIAPIIEEELKDLDVTVYYL